VNYNLPDGWYLSTAPIITANWESNSDDRWTVPVGGGGKIVQLGLRVQVQFLFPK